MNLGAIFIIIVALIGLFAGYPIILFFIRKAPPINGFNLGGINGSGQVPDLPGLRSLVDPETPQGALTMKGLTDGLNYHLVFSDEFKTDGRTFFPGDDPYWEAVDLNYWPTADLEWYSPEAITTKNGSLVIEMLEIQNHDLNFRSGMLQSWNKFCFTTGIIEVSVSLPGSGSVPGYVRFHLIGDTGSLVFLPGFGLVHGCLAILHVQVMGPLLKVCDTFRILWRAYLKVYNDFRYLAIFL